MRPESGQAARGALPDFQGSLRLRDGGLIARRPGTGLLQIVMPFDRAQRRVSLVVAAMALLVLTACTNDARTQAPRVGGDRPTIVSLNPCLDAIAVEIAGPAQVLALSHYSHDPSSSSIPKAVVSRYRTTGGTAEEVIALAPDMVLASSFIAPATRRAFERVGITVETFGSPTSIAESVDQVERIGVLAGREDAAGELIARIENAVSAHPGSRPISALLWQPGQIVAGRRTLVHEMLTRSGFSSHAEARGLGQADHVSLETVLADPPEVLLVAGDSVGQRHPGLAHAREMVVSRLDPQFVYCGGPTIPRLSARLGEIRERLDR